MARLICTVDGFVLPSIVRGWVRWSDDSLEPVSIVFEKDGTPITTGVPTYVRWDVCENGQFNSGFEIDVGSYDILQDVLFDKIAVSAQSASGVKQAARIWDQAKTMMLAQIVADKLEGNPATSLHVFTEYASRLPDSDPMKVALGRAVANVKNAARQEKGSQDVSQHEQSLISLAVGTVSADGSAILGKNGQLFLQGGSNSLLSRYERSEENIKSQRTLADDWINLFHKRRQAIEAAGRVFLHLIVPEKTSVMADLFPLEIQAPTYCLDRIEAALSSQSSHVIVSDVIAAVGHERFHRPTDTHPSAPGQLGLLTALLDRLGYSDMLSSLDVGFDKTITTSGDLSERFFGLPILENALMPTGRRLDDLTPVHREIRASESGRTNSITTWQCKDAPIDKVVVAFGNSVFNHGSKPFELSWWFARLFRNFHFCWNNTIDYEYVADINADVVISQTVERFLFTGAPQQ